MNRTHNIILIAMILAVMMLVLASKKLHDRELEAQVEVIMAQEDCRDRGGEFSTNMTNGKGRIITACYFENYK